MDGFFDGQYRHAFVVLLPPTIHSAADGLGRWLGGGRVRRRVVIVGGGIVGLSHAAEAAEHGWEVTICERQPAATGASIRNFGMIWPIGQPPGRPLALALASRERWLRWGREARFEVAECGSVHLAHRDDEWAVLAEFAGLAAGLGYDCRLLGRDETLRRAPAARADGLRGGLESTTELGVDPPVAIAGLTRWLTESRGVRVRASTAVATIEPGPVVIAGGRRIDCDRVLVCTGSDAAELFPAEVATSGLVNCKLQMLSTPPQPHGFRIGPHLASGLTLRHYAPFRACRALAGLTARIATETPELDRFGIHVMASQPADGRVILGDSHEFTEPHAPFDSAAVEGLILRELGRVIRLPDWSIARRWHGVYSRHPTEVAMLFDPLPGVTCCLGTGGAGMTLAPGIAAEFWSAER